MSEEIDDITKIKRRQKENNALIRELIAELQLSRNIKVHGLKTVFILNIIIVAVYLVFFRDTLSPSYLISTMALATNLRFFSYRSVGKENVSLTNRIKSWLRRDE